MSTAHARSTNNCSAGASPPSPQRRPCRRITRSPRKPSGSWLVASTVTCGAMSSRHSTIDDTAPSRCSQLSSTISIASGAQACANATSSTRPASAGRCSARATASGARRASVTDASSTTHTPVGEARRQRLGGSAREPRLAGAARAHHRHQPRLRERAPQLREFVITSDQASRRRLRRRAGLPGTARAQRQPEAVATPRHGGHRIGAEQLAQRHHLHLEVVVDHHAARPGTREQRIARHHAAARLDQRRQHVERALADAHRRAVVEQFARVRAQHETIELELSGQRGQHGRCRCTHGCSGCAHADERFYRGFTAVSPTAVREVQMMHRSIHPLPF